MTHLVCVLTPEEQHELMRLMKKLGKHAMTTYAKPAAGRTVGRALAVQQPGRQRRHELFPASRRRDAPAGSRLITGISWAAGKTALINRPAPVPGGWRIPRSLINEFGDVALDQLFVQASDGEVNGAAEWVACCCDVRGDLEGRPSERCVWSTRCAGDTPAFEAPA